MEHGKEMARIAYDALEEKKVKIQKSLIYLPYQ